MNKRIFLIGPMGAGKSTIGKKLSQLLGFSFLDTDSAIASEHSLNMSEIFQCFGEKYFRQQEAAVLAKSCMLENIVIATGGGSILNPVTRRLLSQHGTVCYLTVNLEQQMQRLRNDQQRALLPADPLSRLKFLQQYALQREPIYNSIATLTLDTSLLGISEITKMLYTSLGNIHAHN